MHPQSLEIRLLGPLEVRDGAETKELPRSRKARALLAYLAATGQAHSRSALCDLLWPETNDPRAGLRWALSKIRTALEPAAHARLEGSRDQVRLVLDGVRTDLADVSAAVGGVPGASSTQALQEVVGAFRGEFLEGLELSECHGYQAWCLGERERFRSLHLTIRAMLAKRLREEPEAALPHALARLALDPLAEDAYIVAMELLGDLGRVPQALELYDRCRRMLSKHLRRGPSNDLEIVRHRLTSGARAAPQPVGTTPDPPSPARFPEISPEEPALVGRDQERNAVRGLLRDLPERGAGHVVLVTGEPGIGKTRLLREAAQHVRSLGGWVLFGRSFEGEEGYPYGPWIQALHAVPDAALSGGLREDLVGLVPQASTARPPAGPTERAQLFGGVVRLVGRLAERAAPGLVVLDDVQWLDDASAALLHYVTRSLGPSPVLFACAAREGEIDGATTLGSVLRSLERSGRLRRLPLRRLNAAETEALIAGMAATSDRERVFQTSEGNPLFALEMARSLGEGRDTTPTTIEEELDARLERLSPQPLSVVPWAAALGRAFDVPTLALAMDRPAHEVVDAIDTLERRGIVCATGADRYEFSHSLLRQAAYRRPSEPVRRTIHRRIAHALDSFERSSGRMPGAIAHHATHGGLPALAARASLEAAEESVWLFAFDEAAQLTERGLSQVEALADATRLPLQMDLLHVYARLSMRHRRPQDLEARVRRALEEARAAGLPDVVAKGHFALAALQYQRGSYEETRRNSVRSAAAARRSSPPKAVQVLSDAASCLLLLDRDLDRARDLLGEADALAEANAIEAVELSLARALLHHHDGNLDRAVEAFVEVVDLGRRVHDRWWECPARTRRILVDLERQDAAGAVAHAREVERLADRMGDPSEAAFARGLGAVAEAQALPHRAGTPCLSSVDDALGELRTLDDLWMLGELQSHAAELELQRGDVQQARRRATEVWDAARTLGRPSLLAVGRSLLARSAIGAGAPAEAAGHLSASEVTDPPHRLSFRAREAIRHARVAVEPYEASRQG
ncbi:MAG: ATP-binding protein [Myxococcota bacterium]